MQPRETQSVNCAVEGADKLPPELREDGAVCGPLVRAAQAAAAEANIDAGALSLKVRALAPHLLSATVTVDGVALPEQKLGASDRPLNPRSIDMLARALAGQLAEYGASRR